MNYKYGSSGEGVAELQRKLKENGYDIADDGIYGKQTQDAVAEYQTKNKLTVNGIAGNETLSSLGISNAAKGNVTTTKQPAQTQNIAQTANQKLTQLTNGTSSTLDDTINSLYDRVINQKQFEYEPTADPTYNRYADIYARNAKLMSEDALAQAAQLTGGYGSSYGQAVATQAYNDEMSKMNDIIPELRQQALAEHENERQKNIEALTLLLNERDTQRNIFESDRAYDRSVYESDRNYQLSQDQFDWQKDQTQLDRDQAALDRNDRREELALSAGFKSWDDYVKAVETGSINNTSVDVDFEQSFIDGAISAYQEKGVEGLQSYFDVYGMKYSDESLTDLGERIASGYDQNEMFRNVPNMANVDSVERYLRETSGGDALTLDDREFLDSLITYDGTDKQDTPETYQRYLNYMLYKYLKTRKYR